ncbi:MAG: NADH:flavin oxidoreductase [Candidatus Abyssobacteria bacterium SURF_17]|uniref:NADH:flavin oxidoreductase n=1 Tax=Candidatus Abyssobacteria bacterium SURF_17 TaxID=2093361 RepID=A0A419F6I4_9BACT|nr:MAG: NADH:flavin oxidoreductase [Candidatus Abyssubacteria bacterium SURF_17]
MPQNLLFTPIRISKLELPGRLVKSATTETRCTPDGFVTDELIEYYEQIARGGTPLLITGNAYFNLYSKAGPKQLAADHDDKIPGLRRLTDAVHRHGSKIFMQTYHVGRQAIPRFVGRMDAVAPSAVFEPSLGVRPREITRDEIHETIRGFADVATRSQEAGFDGIQIHAAHGYLLSEFLTPHTNRRTDEYGGTFDNRIRLLVDVYRAIRLRVGRDYPVIMKLNGSDDLPFRKGLKPDELVRVAKRMEEEGLDAVEISAGHYESGFTFERGHWKKFFSTVTTIGMGTNLPWYHRGSARLMAPLLDAMLNRFSRYSEGFNLRYSKLFKEALRIPVICVGGFIHREAMEHAITSGECDMVAVARALIADPYLYRHMQQGVEGPQCNFCNACYARGAMFPVDCYDDEIRAHRDRMLREEAK